MQTRFLAPFGDFHFVPEDTPFFYSITLDGYPLGGLALRFGELQALRRTQKGDSDDPYYVSEMHWMPVETIDAGLRYLAENAEQRFPGLVIEEAYRAARALAAYNRTAFC